MADFSTPNLRIPVDGLCNPWKTGLEPSRRDSLWTGFNGFGIRITLEET
jgi:hypothetical protein